MLVLSRKLGEKVVIQVPPKLDCTEIVITVVDIDRGKIRVGIECPKDVPIWREEIKPAAPVPPEPVPVAEAGAAKFWVRK